jgi:hypothetical protein
MILQDKPFTSVDMIRGHYTGLALCLTGWRRVPDCQGPSAWCIRESPICSDLITSERLLENINLPQLELTENKA